MDFIIFLMNRCMSFNSSSVQELSSSSFPLCMYCQCSGLGLFFKLLDQLSYSNLKHYAIKLGQQKFVPKKISFIHQEAFNLIYFCISVVILTKIRVSYFKSGLKTQKQESESPHCYSYIFNLDHSQHKLIYMAYCIMYIKKLEQVVAWSVDKS